MSDESRTCGARSLPALLTYEPEPPFGDPSPPRCMYHVCRRPLGHFREEPPMAHTCRACGHHYLYDTEHPGDGGVRRPDRQVHRGRYCCCVKGSGCKECGT